MDRVGKKGIYWIWATASLLAVFFFILAAIRPHSYFLSIDEGGKFIFLQSILKTGSLSAPIVYPYQELDPQTQFVPLFYRIMRDTEIYTWWSPGLVLFSIPFYWLLGAIGIYILPALAGGITAGLTGLVTLRLRPRNPWLAVLAVIITGLATPIAFYSQVFWEHTLSTAFFMGSLYLLLGTRNPDQRKWALIAGCLGAMSVFFRTETLIILLGFGIVMLIRERRQAFAFGGGFVLVLLSAMAVNYSITGFPFTPNLSAVSSGTPLNLVRNNGIKTIAYFLFNFPRMYALEINNTSMIWGTVLAAGAIIFPFIKRLKWLAIPCYLGVVAICTTVLFSAVGYRAIHGFLLLAPHVLFAVWYFTLQESYKNSNLPYLLLAGFLAFMLVFIIKGWSGAGGLQWGPRYFLPFYPMLVIGSLLGIAQEWQQSSRILRIGLASAYLLAVFVGIGFEVRGMVSVNRLASFAQQTSTYMSNFNDKPALITCDINTLIPEIYWAQPVFSILKSDMDAWMENASQMGIQDFYRLSFDLCFLNNIDEISRYRLENPSGIQAEVCSVREFAAQNPDYCRPLPIPAHTVQ